MHAFNIFAIVNISCLLTILNNLYCTTATWVSLEGCFSNVSGSAAHYIPTNGPRHCFGACKSTTSIGLQGNTCLCDALWKVWKAEQYCSFLCTEEGNMSCGSEIAFSVFSNVTREPARASGNLAYAYVKVSSDGDHTFTYNVTSNASDQHLYICHFATEFEIESCEYTVSMDSWTGARLACQGRSKVLLPERYIVNNSCSPAHRNEENVIQGRYFWIGVIWIMPILEATSTAPATTTTTTTTNITYTASETKPPPPSPSSSSSSSSSKYLSTTTLTGTQSAPTEKTSNVLTVVSASVAAAIIFIAILIFGICWWKKRLRCCKNKIIAGQNFRIEDQGGIDLQHNLKEPFERNMATPSGVMFDVGLYGQKQQRKRKNKKKKNRSKNIPDGGGFEMPPGKSKTRSRDKHKKSGVLPGGGVFDMPAEEGN